MDRSVPTEKPAGDPAAAHERAPEAAASSDDILAVIDQVENQLSALRKSQKERRDAEKQLERREKLIADREEELNVQLEQIHGEKQAAAEMSAENQRRAEGLRAEAERLAAEAERIAELASGAETARAEVAERERAVAEAREAVEAAEREVAQQREALGEREQAAERALAEAREASEALAEARRETEALRAELESSRGEFEEQRRVLESTLQHAKGKAAEEVAAARDEAAAAAARIADLDAALAAARSQAEAAADEAGERDRRLAEAAEALARLEQERDEVRGSLTEAQASAEEAVERFAQRERELSDRVGELTVELEQSRVSVEEHVSRLAALEAAAAAEREAAAASRHDHERKLELAKEKIKELAAALRVQMESSAGDERAGELAAAVEELRTRLASAEQATDAAAQERDAAQAELEAARRELDAARTALEEARAAQVTAQREVEAAPAGEVDGAASDRLQEAQVAAEAAAARCGVLEAERDAAVQRVAKLERALREAAGRIQRLEEQRGDGPAAPGAGIVAGGSSPQLRRERLRRMRVYLKDQSRKVRRASELLHERYRQVDDLLAKRGELVRGFEALRDTQAKLEKAGARSGIAWAVAGVAAAASLFAGLSWVIADQVRPGVYAATATLEAEGRLDTLSDGDLAGWQGYIESLPEDPVFVQEAADRLRQRGLATYGEAGALSALLRESLTLQSPSDGVLRLELRGPGSDRTRRVLDTVAVAMAAEANLARRRRPDAAMTEVTVAAEVGDDPLDHSRLMLAGAIFGGSMVLGLGVGGFGWSRLAAGKRRFDLETRMAEVLDTSGWEDPRAQR